MLLLNLAMCVKHSDFRTFDNQFSHLRDYKATITKVTCNNPVQVHYTRYNPTAPDTPISQILNIHILGNDKYIHFKTTSLTDNYRYVHPLLQEPEKNLKQEGCQYSNGKFNVKIQDNILHVQHISIPLDRIIYQDNIVKYEYENSFGNYAETLQDEALGLQINYNYEQIYGFPEHAAHLDHKKYFETNPQGHDEFIRLYNLDVFEFELNTNMALYGSIPFFLGTQNGEWSGGFWNNPSDTFVKLNTAEQSMNIVSESSAFEFYYFQGTPYEILKAYHDLTGIPQLPQLFSVAFHQCRWNYNNVDDVLRVNSKFTEHSMPVDVIWLDIEHTNGKRYFTWDEHQFADPVHMLDTLKSVGRNMVTIVDPHIKIDDEFSVYQMGKENDYFVWNKDKETFTGDCWPGRSAWFDFLNTKIQDVWASLFEYSHYLKSTPSLFTWNDMNEPSVFNNPEITMNKDNIHRIYEGNDVKEVQHRQVHNIYGQMMQKATAMGQIKRDEISKRPFVLSRAFYAGTQQFGPIWTGDNMANWEHLASTIPMLLGLQTSGLPFVGADIGGFFGNPDGELMSRWMQLGAFQPFMRAHAHIETKRREPWLFEEEYFQSMKKSIRTRYTLLPYIYTLFFENMIESIPIMIPLFFEYPGLQSEDRYLFGKHIWVQGIHEPNKREIEVDFPERYYSFETSQIYGKTN
eukprot:NODE_108_length_18904_cov_0.654826.p1 type:complete len:686 gc:universal NODE_108_length_18904_cov_0.654826:922-2979(+)